VTAPEAGNTAGLEFKLPNSPSILRHEPPDVA